MVAVESLEIDSAPLKSCPPSAKVLITATFLVSKLSKDFISSSADLTNLIFSTNQALPFASGFCNGMG